MWISASEYARINDRLLGHYTDIRALKTDLGALTRSLDKKTVWVRYPSPQGGMLGKHIPVGTFLQMLADKHRLTPEQGLE